MTLVALLLILPFLVSIQSFVEEKRLFTLFACNATVDPLLITSNTSMQKGISMSSLCIKCGIICYQTQGCQGFQLHHFKHRPDNDTSNDEGIYVCQLYQPEAYLYNVMNKPGVYIYVSTFPNSVTSGNNDSNDSMTSVSTNNYRTLSPSSREREDSREVITTRIRSEEYDYYNSEADESD